MMRLAPRQLILPSCVLLCLSLACDSGSGDGDDETGTSASGTSGSGTSTTASMGDLPMWCDPTADWSTSAAALEMEVLALVNARRAEGADCGSSGSFGPAPALSAQANLQCAARMHSLDMETRGFFDHTNPDGEGPQVRVDNSGYDWSTWGENIAAGYPSAEAVMQGWMDSDGHCSNIMNPSFVHLGVGYYGNNQWTQVFGAP